MRILIADDDIVSLHVLKSSVEEWGYEVITADNGTTSLDLLSGEHAPQLAVLDRVMPGVDGAQICSEIRKQKGKPYIYIIMLTAKNTIEDIVEGLEAGADDYMCKPFDPQELQVRIRAGQRIIELETSLVEANRKLQTALAEVKTLSGFIPICSSCKKIRDDKGYWEQIETYIRDRSEAQFSHSICPECTITLYPEYAKKLYPERFPD